MAESYNVVFTHTAYAHLRALRRYDRNAVLDAVKKQLVHTPEQETRNRKRLRENPLSDWELRVGAHRVFYEVDSGRRAVRVLAVGQKEGGRLMIGGREVNL